jgi:hypothetical protein
MPVGTGRGNPNVDPHENPYPLGGYGFLAGPGPGTAKIPGGYPCSSLLTITTLFFKFMVQGQFVSEAFQWIIVHMGATMAPQDIAMYTDVSMHKVRDILSHFNKTGEVKGSKGSKPQLHCSLCDYDIQVSSL